MKQLKINPGNHINSQFNNYTYDYQVSHTHDHLMSNFAWFHRLLVNDSLMLNEAFGDYKILQTLGLMTNARSCISRHTGISVLRGQYAIKKSYSRTAMAAFRCS
jgi:hypothetical protein